MAQEIQVTATVQATKQGTIVPAKGGTFSRDWTGKDWDGGKQQINPVGTDAQGTLITIKSSIGTPGVFWVHNCDTTNFCTFGPRSSGGTFTPFVGNVLATEWYVFPLASAYNACYGRADTAALDIEFVVLER